MFWLDKGPGMINSPELSTRQSLKYLTQMVFQKKPVWEFGWVRKQSTTSLEYMPKSGKAFSGSFVNVGLKKRRYSSYKIFRDDCTVLPVWFSIWLWNQFRPPTVVLKWNIYWRLSLSSSTITDIYIYISSDKKKLTITWTFFMQVTSGPAAFIRDILDKLYSYDFLCVKKQHK